MKQFYFLLVICLLSTSLKAQNYISSNPENRAAVLEEYTGVNCQFCPDGHKKAQAIYDQNPDKAVLINIHAGSFANPGAGQPDFRTAFGEALAAQTGLMGYPSGTINRHLFGTAVTTALDRNAWAANAKEINKISSPVNVGIISTFDPATRELTVNAKLLYTSKSPAAKNYIHVAFIENGYVGSQIDNILGNIPNYVHNHILRNLLTGQWGVEITNTAANASHDLTYKYTVPAQYDINKCDISVFVSESKQEIYNGKTVKANGGNTLIIGNLQSKTTHQIVKTQETKEMTFTIKNELPNDEMFKLDAIAEMPLDWYSTMYQDGIAIPNGGQIKIAAGESKDIIVKLSTSNEKAFASFSLTISSTTYPDAKKLVGKSYLINDVKDLVISHNDNVTYVQNYNDGLQTANNTDNASISEGLFLDFIKASNFTETKNIYFNIGWSFPSLSGAMSSYFKTFLDKGGNLFIAGQDIGWDTWDPAGNSSASKSFYTDYMKAKFISDGAATTKQFNPVTTDEVFGKLLKSTIVDKYGGSNVYPEVIQPLGDAKAIYKYEGNVGTGGIRVKTDKYKLVYLGVNLEQLANINHGHAIIKAAHDWFYGLNTAIEDISESQFNIYPNPTMSKINIINTNGNFDEASLVSIDGKILVNQSLIEGPNQMEISQMKTGTYFINLKNTKTGKLKTSKIQIVN